MSAGARLARALLAAAGWRVHFDGLPGPRGVIVVYPHTSNWDFVVGILAKWSVGLEAHWIGKHTLFRWPLARLLAWWGGIPVRRGERSGTIGGLAARLAAAPRMWIAITPEGTRSRRPGWRAGFYHLALAAGVPVGLVRLDFGRRELRFTEFMRLSGDIDADMARIAAYYADVRGKRHELASPVRLDD